MSLVEMTVGWMAHKLVVWLGDCWAVRKVCHLVARLEALMVVLKATRWAVCLELRLVVVLGWTMVGHLGYYWVDLWAWNWAGCWALK